MTPQRAAQTFFRLSLDPAMLGAEANAVIGLRMMKIAAGGAEANAEVQRMISEKITTAAALQTEAATRFMTGQSPISARGAVAHYRRKVRANRRRLGKT